MPACAGLRGRRAALLGLILALAPGCNLGFRKTTQSTSVSVSGAVQDIATLQRHEYEVLGQAEGAASSRAFFVLLFPIGEQKSRDTLIDDAYYAAADTVEGCDALLVPRMRTRTVVIPLVLLNVVHRSVRLKGRCVRVLGNDELPQPFAPVVPGGVAPAP